MTQSEATVRRAKQTAVRTAGVGPVAERVTALRTTATTDPAGAQEGMWTWIKQLGGRRDAKTLKALFELGTPPAGLDGPADGILVTTVINPLVDLPVRLVTSLWMPWRGKIFDSDAETGINRLTAGSVLPAKLLWPLYRTRATPDGRAAFEFMSGVEPGKIEPRIPVLKIDYRPVSTNPLLLIRQIRDELVELVPNTHLGRILFRLPGDRFTNVGYFALRQPAREA